LLPPAVAHAVSQLVAQGDYASPSEYVTETVRADLKRRADAGLVAKVEEALRSPAVHATPEFWKQFREQLFTDASERRRSA
jgi:Arc/MetJ-type ribon-helix-helix transcriptional regulator